MVEGKNATEVKTAQTELVTFLKETFGRSRTERFNADYPDAVMKFDGIPAFPWVKEHFDEKLELIANPQERFEALSKMFLDETGGLSGRDPKNLNIHKDTNLLANVVLPKLEDALVKAYGTNVVKRSSDKIIIISNAGRTGLSSDEAESLDQLLFNLHQFKRSLKPIDPEKHYGSGLLAEKTEDEITQLDPEEALGYTMIQARLKGDHNQIADTTEGMYNKLREDLQALNKAKSTFVPEVAKAVDSVLETLVTGIPETVSYPKNHEAKTIPVSNFGELAYANKQGWVLAKGNMATVLPKLVRETLQVDLKITDPSEQAKIGRIIIAVANLKNGEAIDPLLEDLTNKPAIVNHVQNTIKQLSDPAYKLDDVKTIITGLGQLIKDGLPATTAE